LDFPLCFEFVCLSCFTCQWDESSLGKNQLYFIKICFDEHWKSFKPEYLNLWREGSLLGSWRVSSDRNGFLMYFETGTSTICEYNGSEINYWPKKIWNVVAFMTMNNPAHGFIFWEIFLDGETSSVIPQKLSNNVWMFCDVHYCQVLLRNLNAREENPWYVASLIICSNKFSEGRSFDDQKLISEIRLHRMPIVECCKCFCRRSNGKQIVNSWVVMNVLHCMHIWSNTSYAMMEIIYRLCPSNKSFQNNNL